MKKLFYILLFIPFFGLCQNTDIHYTDFGFKTAKDIDFDSAEIIKTNIVDTEYGMFMIRESVNSFFDCGGMDAGMIGIQVTDTSFTNVRNNAGTINYYFYNDTLRIQNLKQNNCNIKLFFIQM
jgi:hypothetical protein